MSVPAFSLPTPNDTPPPTSKGRKITFIIVAVIFLLLAWLAISNIRSYNEQIEILHNKYKDTLYSLSQKVGMQNDSIYLSKEREKTYIAYIAALTKEKEELENKVAAVRTVYEQKSQAVIKNYNDDSIYSFYEDRFGINYNPRLPGDTDAFGNFPPSKFKFITLPDTSVKLGIADIIKGDGYFKELGIRIEQLQISNRQLGYKDSLLSEKDKQFLSESTIAQLKDKQIAVEEQQNKDLTKKCKRLNVRNNVNKGISIGIIGALIYGLVHK